MRRGPLETQGGRRRFRFTESLERRVQAWRRLERAARTAPAPAATTNGEIERGAMANAKQERRRRSDAGLSLGDMAKMRMAHDTVSKEHGK